MRKIFIYIAVAALTLLLLSCDNEMIMQQKETNETWDMVTEFYYKGHAYIKFNKGYHAGVIHDPDCPCNGN